VLEVGYLGGDLEVAVVVQDRHSVLSCQHGGQQVGDAYRSVLPGASQDALRVERTLPVTVVGGRYSYASRRSARTWSYSAELRVL
jgi:hypothetical protein